MRVRVRVRFGLGLGLIGLELGFGFAPRCARYPKPSPLQPTRHAHPRLLEVNAWAAEGCLVESAAEERAAR